MCLCNPNIKTPYCPNCVSAIDAVKQRTDRKYEMCKREEIFVKVKEIIMIINGMSEDGFNTKYMNDPSFNKGVSVLVELISQGKFK